ncbi:MAG: hypothetical protein ACYCXI_00235 [Dethiobacteraceae bacterium]
MLNIVLGTCKSFCRSVAIEGIAVCLSCTADGQYEIIIKGGEEHERSQA